jgi:hypothetical protein
LDLEVKAELLMVIEDYRCVKRKQRENIVDITASDDGSNEKILLRIITEPESKSSFVSMSAAESMVTTLKDMKFDGGILLCDRITAAAKRILRQEGVKQISGDLKLDYELNNLYPKFEQLVNALCKTKCGKIPKKVSDCNGYSDKSYSCDVRLINDNAVFHFKHGWRSSTTFVNA